MYYYVLNGAQTGPISEEELRSMVASGQLRPDTLVWREGMAQWQPFASVFGGMATTGANQELYAIALNQRKVLMCVAVQLLLYLCQAAATATIPILALLPALGVLITLVFSVIYIYRLAKSLGFTAILYAVLMIIPCINLLVMLIVTSRATKRLKDAGLRVGLLGVSKAEIDRLQMG